MRYTDIQESVEIAAAEAAESIMCGNDRIMTDLGPRDVDGVAEIIVDAIKTRIEEMSRRYEGIEVEGDVVFG